MYLLGLPRRKLELILSFEHNLFSHGKNGFKEVNIGEKMCLFPFFPRDWNAIKSVCLNKIVLLIHHMEVTAYLILLSEINTYISYKNMSVSNILRQTQCSNIDIGWKNLIFLIISVLSLAKGKKMKHVTQQHGSKILSNTLSGDLQESKAWWLSVSPALEQCRLLQSSFISQPLKDTRDIKHQGTAVTLCLAALCAKFWGLRYQHKTWIG